MKHKKKRLMAGFLAIVLFCLTFIPYIPIIQSHAATFAGKNLWTGGSEIMFGKSRNYLYRWTDKFQDTFCINPKFHMGSDVYAGAVRYNIEDSNIPYIESKEDFERLALICDWYEKKGSIMSPNAQYVAAQGAIWAIVEGEWDNVESIMNTLDRHISGGVSSYWRDLKSYIETAYAGANGLPFWCSTTKTNLPVQNMTMKNGKYQIDLDFSQKPDIAYVQWNLPDGWSKSISGTTLTFIYTGSMTPPIAIIDGIVPESMASIKKNSQNLTIYLPYRDRDQPMISAGLSTINMLYINIGGASTNEPGTPGDLELYRHSETFNSTYKIDLKKYCAETGKELAESTFQVLEAFNSHQLGDGTNGTVSKEFMSPSPATWSGFRVCDEILTDSNGHAEHTDRRSYDYDKTYCGGHPEPDYVEVPDVGEDGSGADEAAAAEEENDRLFEEWQALVEACEDLASDGMHFHSVGEGAAKEMMVNDRDATYEAFINLQYEYTLKEKTARPGYILHGQHNDDQPIETIITDASEAGGNSSITGGRTIIPEKISHTVQEKPLKGMLKTWNGLSIFPSLPSPAAKNQLEDIRIIEGIFESDRTKQLATPLDVQKNTDNQGGATPLDAAKKASPLNAQKKASPLDAEKENIQDDELEELEEEDTIWLINDLGLDSPDLNPEEEPLETDTPNGYTLLERTYDVIREKAEFSTKASLPSPTEDDVPPVSSGSSSNLSYTFVIYDHRTEGEFHINKRDWELYQADKDGSYGKTQGDATLEGAVYGLYASEDIIHPDGKTGKVFSRNDLVSIAATDKEGNASFLCITEVTLTSSLALNQAGTWIGHPLLLGNYYVKEISRSEGYELSVQGINLTETNRTGSGSTILANAGTASASGLSHPVDEHDGSWNEFTVTNFKTEDGYDVFVNGYPKGSRFYAVERKEETTIESVVIGTETVETGDYQKAEPGERKMDASGNDIPIRDADGNLVYDISKTESETYFINYRLNAYPKGTALPAVNKNKWADTTSVDAAYVKAEANSMLRQIGYKALDDTHGNGSPWKEIELTGVTNAELITNILDWYALNDFWDSGAVESVYQDGSVWKATIFHDYQALKNRAIYDAKNGDLYIRKDITVSGGAVEYHGYIPYNDGEFTLNGYYGTAIKAKKYLEGIPFKGNMEDYLTLVHPILYETYGEGEYRLDHNGNKIPETETRFIYGDMPQTVVNTYTTPIDAVYDKEKEQYFFHVDNVTDWTTQTERTKSIFRAAAPEKSIVVDGEEMDYADYLVNIKGAGVLAAATPKGIHEGSYIQFLNLVYPGQMKVYQDSQTREKPAIVQQRIIKQAIKVTKDISQDSYKDFNTYNIHKDPFTVIFGGYLGKGRKYISGFRFKAYLKTDLINTNRLNIREDGEYDYQEFFTNEENKDLWTDLAVLWDRKDYDRDKDLTTIHADQGNGMEPYYGTSIMLPYGTYVVVEQIPEELVHKHYKPDYPREVEIPFVPEIEDDKIHQDIPSREYLYDCFMTPEEMVKRYGIRFHEENHQILAHNHSGDFTVYKYGLAKGLQPEKYKGSTSEQGGFEEHVYYETYIDRNGNVTDYGISLSHVPNMTGKTTMIDRKYAKALVPWSILDPRYGDIINDNGDIGNRDTGLDENGSFNFVAFLVTHFENTFYHSKLRIEKIDAETEDNIIHDGAIFKIYAAKRDVKGDGIQNVSGTGNVIYKKETVTGTKADLEALGYVDHIMWDKELETFAGTAVIPDYDEKEQIFLKDVTGAETGIFKAFSTVKEVVHEDGSIKKEKVGYIETYQPLGAGVYVLVEVQAPEGYMKSRPVAFEVYQDKTTYYAGGIPGRHLEGDRYQYVKLVSAEKSPEYEDVIQIEVMDKPISAAIHKVETGDEKVGDQNGIDGLADVNDKGDLISYIVRGRREYLERRGDVKNITWDSKAKEYFGTVTKSYQEWSRHLIKGSEEYLQSLNHVKLLYDVNTGAFTGCGIRFDTLVKNSRLTLYDGLEIKPLGNHAYQGVSVTWEFGKVAGIEAEETGSHLEITTREKSDVPPYPDIWDTEEIRNDRIPLFFYDLSLVRTKKDEVNGELLVLDGRGNPICYADSLTGMAYVYDDFGRMIAYRSDSAGEKVVTKTIQLQNQDGKETIYQNVEAELDENHLPSYYISGEITWQEESWITEKSEGHIIKRIPIGAYILEETEVPHNQGYIQSMYQGIVVSESSSLQHFYLENDFTKAGISKVDITTKEEIQGAHLVLYEAERIEDDSPKGYHLKKGKVYTEWISGYAYDDNGNLKLIKGEEKVATTEPHWIDHIPYGYYILEEKIVPEDWGYVQAEEIEIYIAETGDVQTFVMEDDYTAMEVRKYDSLTGTVLSSDNPARLSLYRASLDNAGRPVMKPVSSDSQGILSEENRTIEEIPVWNSEDLIVTWMTEDGKDVEATKQVVVDEYGVTKIRYDYQYHNISTTKHARYYTTERGTTRFEYLPPGYYVLVEEAAPEGFASAAPILITIEPVGQKTRIFEYSMEDKPLKVNISKVQITGGKEVAGAKMEIYKMIDGIRQEFPLYQWISGNDGIYTEQEKEDGTIPEGYEAGDLKPHLIQYIPAGDYILVEHTAPYGFLQSTEAAFTILDTQEIQSVQMVDSIPMGELELLKHDADDKTLTLEGAVFVLRNETRKEDIQTLVTDQSGKAKADQVPIGYLSGNGLFTPFTYTVREVEAPKGYMVNPVPFEFQFEYQDGFTPVISYHYNASNQQNQVRISKKVLSSQEELPGASLQVIDKRDGRIVDAWISTNQPHYINGIADGEYILVELETPGSGFAKAESIEFHVSDHMVEVLSITMYDKATEVEINKLAGNGNRLLPGARLRLSKPDGTTVAEWTSSDREKVFYGLEPGEYIIEELEAPFGYEAGLRQTIIVDNRYGIQSFPYRNYRITTHDSKEPDEPGEIEISEPPKVLGFITAHYPSNGTKGNGKYKNYGKVPRMGDNSAEILVWAGVMAVSAALLILMIKKGMTKRKRR